MGPSTWATARVPPGSRTPKRGCHRFPSQHRVQVTEDSGKCSQFLKTKRTVPTGTVITDSFSPLPAASVHLGVNIPPLQGSEHRLPALHCSRPRLRCPLSPPRLH